MTAKIEIIYHAGCPNAPVARANLRAALQTAALPLEWQELDQNDPTAPPHARQFGSPTVLVNGRDVTGQEPAGEAAACRADGAPSVDVIRAALVADA